MSEQWFRILPKVPDDRRMTRSEWYEKNHMSRLMARIMHANIDKDKIYKEVDEASTNLLIYGTHTQEYSGDIPCA